MIKNRCTLCPRECGADRSVMHGFCKLSSDCIIARAMLHKWEEPPICYGNGSGAVFFSGCQLGCIFCQNHEISQSIFGKSFSSDELCDLFLTLQEKGACNINLVSPTPHLKTVIPALEKAKGQGLTLPIVFNSGGYEKAETLKKLEGLIDVYLPDYKFFDKNLSLSMASCPDYSDIAYLAIEEMLRQTKELKWDGEHLLKGVIIRHLVLPGHSKDSIDVVRQLDRLKKKGDFILSLLWQYTPAHKAKETVGMNRKVTRLEYERVLNFALTLDFPHVFSQEKESADPAFIPDFSLNFLDK